MVTILLSLFAVLVTVASEEESTHQFSISPDPSVRVLEVDILGSTGVRYSYSLFGDGRLLMLRTSLDASHVFESLESSLSYEEVDSLVQSAVESGLVEFDEAKVRRREGLPASPTIVSSDGTSMILSLNLETYDDGSGREAFPVSVTIAVDDPASKAERLPSVKEYRALSELARRLRHYKKAAKGG